MSKYIGLQCVCAGQVLETLPQKLDSHLEQQQRREQVPAEQAESNRKSEEVASSHLKEVEVSAINKNLTSAVDGPQHSPRDGASLETESSASGPQLSKQLETSSPQESIGDIVFVAESQPHSPQTTSGAAKADESLSENVSQIYDVCAHHQVCISSQRNLQQISNRKTDTETPAPFE